MWKDKSDTMTESVRIKKSLHLCWLYGLLVCKGVYESVRQKCVYVLDLSLLPFSLLHTHRVWRDMGQEGERAGAGSGVAAAAQNGLWVTQRCRPCWAAAATLGEAGKTPEEAGNGKNKC